MGKRLLAIEKNCNVLWTGADYRVHSKGLDLTLRVLKEK